MQMEIRKIGELRRRLGLTQSELARLSGVSQSLIAKLEAGKIDIAYSKAVAIFTALENRLTVQKHRAAAKDIMTPGIIFAKPSDNLDSVMNLMRKNAISQLPVVSDGKPLGSISDEAFVDWMVKYGPRISKIQAREVMGEGFPTIPENSSIEAITELLKFYKALLVKRGGEIAGIITKSDLIKAMKSGDF